MLRSMFAQNEKKKRQKTKQKHKRTKQSVCVEGIQVPKIIKYLWQSNGIYMRFVLRQVCFINYAYHA